MSNITQYFNRIVNYLVPHGTTISEKLSYLGFLALLLTIPFSIRYVFDSAINYETGAYSDFTSLSLYLSDILVIFICLLNLKKYRTPLLLKLTVLWAVIEVVIHFTGNIQLELYFLVRFGALVTLAWILFPHAIYLINKRIIALLFVIVGVIQATIAGLQFWFQKSLGLTILGESILNSEILGVAKIVAHGTKLIRGYGTFPHPNLLGAFLVTTTLFNLYLLTKNYQFKYKILLCLAFFINILGVFLTFSRASIGALILGIFIYCVLLVVLQSQNVLKIIALSAISIFLSVIILFPYLSSRATITDAAVKERGFYNDLGWNIIRDKPIFGTGPGTNVLHMEQYSGVSMQPWEKQPIHNYYLLSWSEWGMGAILVLLLVFYPILKLWHYTYNEWEQGKQRSTWNITLGIIGSIYAILFLFDHYFYTIWPSQLLLWLIIGLIMASINTSQNNKRA